MIINVDSSFPEDHSTLMSAGNPGCFCLDLPEIHPGGNHPSIYDRNPLIGIGRGKGVVVGVCPVHIPHIARIERGNRGVFLHCHTAISLTLFSWTKPL
jgi:hypothetical protein